MNLFHLPTLRLGNQFNIGHSANSWESTEIVFEGWGVAGLNEIKASTQSAGGA